MRLAYSVTVVGVLEHFVAIMEESTCQQTLDGSYLKSAGIHHELTEPHSPQQNGIIAERMNRTLIESAQSMLDHSGLPDKYWSETVECAAYIRNRLPTTA